MCGCTGAFTTRAIILVPKFQDLGTLVGLNGFVKSPLLMDQFSRYQVFHLTTLQIDIMILVIQYVVLLLDFDIEFP